MTVAEALAPFGTKAICWAGKTISPTCLNVDKPQPSTENENENENEMKVLQVVLGLREMQLIWTPKLINILWRQTLEVVLKKTERRRNRVTTFFSPLLRIYLRLIIKQPKAYVLFAHKDENKLVAPLATCHLPLPQSLPHATGSAESSWLKSSRLFI